MSPPPDIWWHIANLVGWLALGGIGGFYYAWRSTRDAYREALDKHVKGMEPGPARGYTRGYILGWRQVVGLLYAFWGAIAGAVIWAAATALILILN